MSDSRLPVALELRGRPVVVVGGGAVAERKVGALCAVGALVTVIAPELTSALAAQAASGAVTWLARPYADGDLGDCWLAVAATDLPAVNEQVAAEAESRRLWCNVAAPPEAGNCQMLATVRRAGVTVALATDGASPYAARRLRESIEAVITPELAQLVALMGELRERVQQCVSQEATRRACWEAMWQSPAAAEALANGEMESARAVLRAIVDEAADRA